MKFSALVVGLAIYFSLHVARAETCEEFFNGSVEYLDSNLKPAKQSWEAALEDYRKVVLFDWLRYDLTRKKEKLARKRAFDAIKKDKHLQFRYSSLQRVLESYQTDLLDFERGFVFKRWEMNYFVDPDMPSQQLPSDMIKSKYKKLLSPPVFEAFSGIIDASNNAVQVYNWIIKVREEVLRKMWEDGLRGADSYSNSRVREYYLDRVLAERAQAHGFKVDKNGMPFGIYSFSNRAFFKTLSSKAIFLDWTGLELYNGVDGKMHLVRGHMIAMAYLAEHVPNYAKFIEYIGVTRDRDGFWAMFSDNTRKNNSPFYNTYWIHVFGDLLGIQY